MLQEIAASCVSGSTVREYTCCNKRQWQVANGYGKVLENPPSIDKSVLIDNNQPFHNISEEFLS
jgi:hypothetical protein